jgi:signal transduction histidine kinase
MLSAAKSSRQPATRAVGGSTVETTPPDTPRENWHGRMLTLDPLSLCVIHDLRNPLAAICISAEMLNDPHLTPVHAERLGRNIRRAAGRMRKLLADLVCVTQGRMTATETCPLGEILAVACEDLAVAADKQGVDILVDLPARMEMTVARPRMERVFINLLTNALEAMPLGGKIRIAARQEGNCALIEVEDSGPGIPAEIYGRLFDPFVTAGKKDGLGLGLALARRTVRDHGGDMWLEPAGGARFVIRLPMSGISTAAFNEVSCPNRAPTTIPPI